ncbi:MAG: Stealth CR1 domain-containing protein [Acinetobacter pittii]|jgi:hypothetical protein|nr:Stealth CR1 domain-containing protein [Vagococcus sp.]MDR3039337.1 Stealth CR1 domain-containing protein [Acinetobacter pittii]
MNKKIDFVITWVNSKDPKWITSFNLHNKNEKYDDISDMSEERYRDWDNLKYWFRGVEKYAPWVNQVFFITAGHLPSWLNINNEKLTIVKHSEYIDEKFLPTFNSRVIELNLVNIKNLSEKFVLFNDDFFLINPVYPTDFFSSNGLPLDYFVLNAESGGSLSPIVMNNLELINKHINKRKFIFKNISKFINIKYRFHLIKNLLLLPWPNITGFYETHLPQSYLKSTCMQANELFSYDIKRTYKSRFRLKSDVNHYLYRFYALITGSFTPRRPGLLGSYYSISKSNCSDICDVIKNTKNKVIAINDSSEISNFNDCKSMLNNSFSLKFPHKSSFEI